MTHTSMSCWTKEEVDYLKRLFQKGLSLKEMSHHLGRSPSALNKALNRFDIRKQKKTFPVTLKFFPKKNVSFSSSSALSKRACNSKNTPPNSERRSITSQVVHWVSLNDVVDWLNSHYIRVSKYTTASNTAKTINHYIGKVPVTPLQLVMYANNLRLQKKQTIFMVCGVTW